MDSHPCLLEGLGIVFRDAGDIDLVAHARSAHAALDVARTHRPDVMVMEVRPAGIEAIERLADVAPRTAAVVYSAHGDRRLLTDAIAAGARGYVLKCSPVTDLLRAVRAVAGGGPYVDPALSPALMMDAAAPGTQLPEREREILQLLAEGFRTGDVAERTGLSAETVKSATRSAIRRLEATGRVHAVANALRLSYIG